jgi:hypothetical protein
MYPYEDNENNLVAACDVCNSHKSAKLDLGLLLLGKRRLFERGLSNPVLDALINELLHEKYGL